MNINIKVKELVSKNKRRFVNEEYNLDLSYVTQNIIAMGFPSERIEGMYRNHIGDVCKFMEQYHKGHYKIYNLRRDGTYDASKFHGRVVHYPMDDHHPPTLLLMRPFCEDVHKWLNDDDQNVVAVHCKAGKGRTGVMICAYLLYRGLFSQPIDALRFYGEKRTMDMNGVTIPSQRRYVEYFNGLLKTGLTPHRVPMVIRSIHLEAAIHDPSKPFAAFFAIYANGKRVYKSLPQEYYGGMANNESSGGEDADKPSSDNLIKAYGRPIVLSLMVPKEDHPILISGDVRVDIYQKTGRMKKKLFHFWFNTFFLCPGASNLSEPKATHKVSMTRSRNVELNAGGGAAGTATSGGGVEYINDEVLPFGGVRSHIIVPPSTSTPVYSNSGLHPQLSVSASSPSPVHRVDYKRTISTRTADSAGTGSEYADREYIPRSAYEDEEQTLGFSLQVRSHIRLDTLPESTVKVSGSRTRSVTTDVYHEQQLATTSQQQQPIDTIANTANVPATNSVRTSTGQENWAVGCCSLNPRTYTAGSAYNQANHQKRSTGQIYKDLDDSVGAGYYSSGNRNQALVGPNDPELATAFHHSTYHTHINVPGDHHCLTLCKSELDRACKDRRNVKFPGGLKVHLIARCCDEYEYGSWMIQQQRCQTKSIPWNAVPQRLILHHSSNNVESDMKQEAAIADAEANAEHVCPLWTANAHNTANNKRMDARGVVFELEPADVDHRHLDGLRDKKSIGGQGNSSGHDIHWSSDSEDEMDEDYNLVDGSKASVGQSAQLCASQQAAVSDSHSVGSAQECST